MCYMKCATWSARHMERDRLTFVITAYLTIDICLNLTYQLTSIEWPWPLSVLISDLDTELHVTRQLLKFITLEKKLIFSDIAKSTSCLSALLVDVANIIFEKLLESFVVYHHSLEHHYVKLWPHRQRYTVTALPHYSSLYSKVGGASRGHVVLTHRSTPDSYRLTCFHYYIALKGRTRY